MQRGGGGRRGRQKGRRFRGQGGVADGPALITTDERGVCIVEGEGEGGGEGGGGEGGGGDGGGGLGGGGDGGGGDGGLGGGGAGGGVGGGEGGGIGGAKITGTVHSTQAPTVSVRVSEMAGCVQFVTANTCASERSVVIWTDTSLLCTTYSHGAVESSSSGERALV